MPSERRQGITELFKKLEFLLAVIVFLACMSWHGLPLWFSGKESTAVQETQEMCVQSLHQEDSLEEDMTNQTMENPMDRGAWQAAVHRVPKSPTWLKWLSVCAYVLTYHILHVNLGDQWLSFNFPFDNSVYFFMAVLGLGCDVGFSLVVRRLLQLLCPGFSLRWLLPLRTRGPRRTGFSGWSTQARCCGAQAYGTFLDRRSSRYPLRWQADSTSEPPARPGLLVLTWNLQLSAGFLGEPIWIFHSIKTMKSCLFICNNRTMAFNALAAWKLKILFYTPIPYSECLLFIFLASLSCLKPLV